MDVFLIPSGASNAPVSDSATAADRYHLYCEVADEDRHEETGEEHEGWPDASSAGRLGRWLARWRQRAVERFAKIVAGVESARHAAAERRAARASRSLRRRVSDRVICWMAEKIAEQRLLWHLRRQSEATAWFADDIEEREAAQCIERILAEDAQRHGRWAAVHAVAGAVSLLLMPIPGPNLIGYYFTFRFVGHYLSRSGARHGLKAVRWIHRPSPLLTELRHAFSLEPRTRRSRIAAIASQLRLEHLASFVERLAVAAS